MLVAGLCVMTGFLCGCASEKVVCSADATEGQIRFEFEKNKNGQADSMVIIYVYPFEIDQAVTGNHLPVEDDDPDGSKQKASIIAQSIGSSLGINPDLVQVREENENWVAKAAVRDIAALFERYNLSVPNLDFDALKSALSSSGLFSCS